MPGCSGGTEVNTFSLMGCVYSSWGETEGRKRNPSTSYTCVVGTEANHGVGAPGTGTACAEVLGQGH